jgi:hypothetical protein
VRLNVDRAVYSDSEMRLDFVLISLHSTSNYYTCGEVPLADKWRLHCCYT